MTGLRSFNDSRPTSKRILDLLETDNLTILGEFIVELGLQ